MASGLVDKGKGMASEATSSVMQGVFRERDKVFTRPGDTVRKKDGLVEELVRSAAAGIGVISEALHHRKDKKSKDIYQAKEFQRTKITPESAQKGQDEASSYLNVGELGATKRVKVESSKNSSNLAAAFINRHAYRLVKHSKHGGKLPLPVVVPQRRPENRARGFIRAYAPVLADVGIDQELFLDFIDTFNKALEPSPWINALNLAGFAGSAMPEPASMLFGFGVEYATEAALEGHSRYSSNTFLDHVNTQFFNPHGLVCLVVTWQPDMDDNQLKVNFEGDVTASQSQPGISERITDVATQKTSAKEGWQGMKDQMAEMMKLSNGNFAWPEPAPLVFPADEDITSNGKGTGAKKKNALDRMEIWMDNVSDKRAQAKWIDENSERPAANLIPNHEFRSRYADPNHPAASGDVVALVTGGRWTYADKKHASKSKKDKQDDKSEEDENDKKPRKDEGGEKSKKVKAKDKRTSSKKDEDWLKSLFQKDVLYLVVLNLPSKEQLTGATTQEPDAPQPS